MADTTQPKTTIIVGAGVFGASAALHHITKHPTSSITLIDRDPYTAPTRVAASWDWNKVIRSDYLDPTYTRLGLEAQQLWRSSPVFQEYYHESGVVWISPSTFGRTAIANFEAIGADVDVEMISVEETKKLGGGCFAEADYTGITEVLLDRSSGWAEAKEALGSAIRAAVDAGVRYVAAEVAGLVFDEEGRCAGVRLADGEVLAADRVVLCTGAYTPALLINSAPGDEKMHAGGRILAFGVTEGTVPLEEGKAGMLDTMPVGINDNPLGRGVDAGCLPLPKQGEIKTWGQILFRNTVTHPLTGEVISTPPVAADYNQWDVPPVLKDDARHALKSLFGDSISGEKMNKFRICWDAATPSGDFIVSPHSGCEGLFVATCGSFHGFKFLPVIGKYVVQMLDGELDAELEKKWAWDRELPPTEGNKQWPTREYREFMGQAAAGSGLS
ncbi:FAD dependent oxidoreductase [Echria macrotheca]|uniref:FAD dependent oxidoreductase n=1 Tax=Echria macrotheca TaxID=438768 RepID=A0AAJ0F4T1_9PEZI|nr:FAD dependent oxidoreductase [Echria macrotheca]